MRRAADHSELASLTPGSILDPKETNVVCRVVVRGRTRIGGKVLRRVRNIAAKGNGFDEYMTDAQQSAERHGIFDEMAKMANFVEVTSTAILPPVGLKLDRSISTGWGSLPDGKFVWVRHGHHAGAPVPTATNSNKEK